MYPLYWTTPAKGVSLYVTVMNSREKLLIYIGRVNGRKHRKGLKRRAFIAKYGFGFE